MIDIKAIAQEAFEQVAKKLKPKFGKVISIEWASLWRDGKYVLQPKRIQQEKGGKWVKLLVGSFGISGGNHYEIDIEKLTEEMMKEEKKDE
jgi:hypothetical protein